MKQLKVVVLVLATTATLGGMVGSSTALAAKTKLCHENKASCPVTQIFPEKTVIIGKTKDGSATWGSITEPATLVTNLGSVRCDSTMEVLNGSSEGEPLSMTVNQLTFASCTVMAAGETVECSVGGGSGHADNTPYTAELQANGSGNGSLTISKGNGGNPGVTIVCSFEESTVISCTFSKAPMSLSFTGGAPMVAKIEASAIELQRAGTKCPTVAKWSAKYFLTTPNEEIFATT